MRVTVFGATGGIGRHVVDRLLAEGHEVVAVARDPGALPAHERLTTVAADIADPAAVERAVAGSDAVVWAVGATRNTPDQPALFEAAARALVGAMERHGVRRLVALSGAGITLEGERKPFVERLVSALVARIVRHVYEAKRREYEVFRRSGLDWTLVRPPRVVDGGPTGRLVAGDRLAGRRVTQGDVAEFIVRALADPATVGRAPYVATAAPLRRPSRPLS